VNFLGRVSVPTRVSLSVPLMKASTRLKAMSSWSWMGGSLEVGARGHESALETTIQTELQAPQGIDHDAGGVGAVPDLGFISHFNGTSPKVVPSMTM